ncbi:MAG: DEAD/DEAH box helicase [Anaerolineae bacterium]|nr:DEAD/DEAH box helicase [Anaerolineae bacterium]
MSNLWFQGGTLVLEDIGQDAAVHSAFRWEKAKWRCEAYHYADVLPWINAQAIRDSVPHWQRLDLTLHDDREPHDYQVEALDAWDAARRRGSIVLPTGAGKTFVAIHAIHRAGRSAVIIAPTIDLLHQWYARLVNAFEIDIGVYYGGEKKIEPITVTTYHSSGDLIADYGDHFELIIFDEVHHLPAPSWGETALMAPAPCRLGLTATYPEAHEQQDERWNVVELIGPIVYEKYIDDLTGERLAEYRTERVRVDLTPDERAQYDADYAIYAGFFRSRNLQKTHGADWYRELMRLSAFDAGARRALLARQRITKLLAGCAGKRRALAKLLREYDIEQILIFTETNAVAYDIARAHLIPALTHETKTAERKHILEGFQAGKYRAIVTSKVLDEGVDVPEAKVAIILGGFGKDTRQYIQRLGRVLRKVGNRQAALFHVIVRDTVDERKAQSRKSRSE